MISPKVVIIILNWNGKEDTIECLESLKYLTYPIYEILLVDNGSVDGSVEYFREKYPKMQIIENGNNLGFAEGNNVGIRKAINSGIEYILLLNNDTIVDPEFLTELMNIAQKDNTIGILGPKVYSYNNPLKIQAWTKKTNLYTGNFTLKPRLVNDDNSNTNEEVDNISGCCMLITLKAIEKAGILDPEYFLYWEETDWCYRVRRSSLKIVYVHKSKIWHKIGSSSGSNVSFYYYGRNLFMFIKKNANLVQKVVFMFFFICIRFWIQCIIIIVLHKNIPACKSFLKGTADGIKIFYRGF